MIGSTNNIPTVSVIVPSIFILIGPNKLTLTLFLTSFVILILTLTVKLGYPYKRN